MVLRDTLVSDSENWFPYQPFPVVSLFLCLGPSFIGAVISVIKVSRREHYTTQTSTATDENES